MYKTFSLTLGILLVFSSILLATENINPGCESVGIGRIHTTLTNIWSVNGNSAGLAAIDYYSVSSSYTQKFMLPQVSSKAIAMVIPSPIFIFAASYQRFGYRSYNENLLTTAFARKFGEKFLAGFSFNTTIINMKGSNELQTQYKYNIGCGIMWIMSSKLNFGALLNDIIPDQKFTTVESYFDPALAIGLSYQMVELVKCFLEIKNTYYGKSTFAIGTEVAAIKYMQFQFGVNFSNVYSSMFSFGMSTYFRIFNLSLAFEKHPYLGFSSFIELTMKLK